MMTILTILLAIFIWLFLCVIVGVFASQRRNRNGLGYFLLSLLLSPLVGGLIVACLRTLPEQPRRGFWEPPAHWDASRPALRAAIARWGVVAFVLLMLVALMATAKAESRSYYSASGAYAGSSITRNGSTTFTDGGGRYVGSSVTRGNTTVIYGANGSRAGSSTRTGR